MRIAVISQEIYPLFYGGIGVQMYLLTEQLARLGNTVEFFTRRPSTIYSERQPPVLENARFRYVESAYVGNYLCSLGYASAIAACVRQVHQETPFDLIIATDFGGDSLFVQLDPPLGGSGAPVPILMTLHGASRDVNRANSKELTVEDEILCLQEEIAVLSSSICLTPSRAYWDSLAARMPLSDMPFKVVPNFFSEKVFSQRIGSAAASGASKRLVFVGRLERRKGVDLLLEAFSILAARDAELELHVVGKDLVWSEYGTSFESYWKGKLSTTVADRVFFYGNQSHEEVQRVLSSAYVAVFPSRWEPFGIVALEALGVGVPVIVPEATGLAEIVGDSGGLVVSQPCTSQKLAEVLSHVLADEELRGRLASSASQRAAQLLHQAQTSLAAVLAEAATGKIHSRIALPRAHIARLQQLVWEFGSTVADARGEKIKELGCEIEERDVIIQRQADAILERDTLILNRDDELTHCSARVSKQEEEIVHLQKLLADRDAQLAGKSAVQESASRRRWWPCGRRTRTQR
jgi:glycosyltransferase involved in cell wall biosynthesis